MQTFENRFSWFRKWVLERQTYKTLQRDSGLSKDTLQRTFYYFLLQAPLTPIIHHDNIYLRVDATYFKRFCVVCYQDDFLSYTQLFRFSDAERYEEIKEDLTNLLNLGLQIDSITTDGHKATLKAIKKVMPTPRFVSSRTFSFSQFWISTLSENKSFFQKTILAKDDD